MKLPNDKGEGLDCSHNGEVSAMSSQCATINGAAKGVWGQVPPTFAKTVLEISLKLVRK